MGKTFRRNDEYNNTRDSNRRVNRAQKETARFAMFEPEAPAYEKVDASSRAEINMKKFSFLSKKT